MTLGGLVVLMVILNIVSLIITINLLRFSFHKALKKYTEELYNQYQKALEEMRKRYEIKK